MPGLTPSSRRLPGAVRWAAVAGAVASVCLVVAIALLVVLRRDASESLEPGAWLAIIVPAEGRDGRQLRQIRAVNTATGRELAVGDPGLWNEVTWSPDGRLLYAVELLLGQDASITSVRLVLFDVAGGRTVAQRDWPDAFAKPYWLQRAVWSPDGAVVAMPAFPFAGVMTLDGRIEGAELGANPSENASTTGHLAWSPDSSRWAFVGGISLGLALIDRAGAVTFNQPDVGGWVPAGLRESSLRPQVLAVEWASTDALNITALTSRWEPGASQPADGSTRYWQLRGRVSAAGTVIDWMEPREIADPIARLVRVERVLEVQRGHGLVIEPGVFEASPSSNGQFGGGLTIYHEIAAAAPPQAPREAWFVTFVDGVRFAYSLGRPEPSSLAALRGSQTWDIIRVP